MTDRPQDRNQNDPSDFIEEAPDVETSTRDTAPAAAGSGDAAEDVDPSIGGVDSP